MSETLVDCPHCGATVRLPILFKDVTFRRNSQNISIPCPKCGGRFDGAPEDGTYSTVGGRLHRVVDDLRSASHDELRALQEQLLRAQLENSREQAEAVMGSAAPSLIEAARPANFAQFWMLVAAILLLIALLLGAATETEFETELLDLSDRIADIVGKARQ